jgi:translation initiation factor 1 (eIF-1/SUI1)
MIPLTYRKERTYMSMVDMTNENNEVVKEEVPQQDEKKMIVLDGPLSNNFTDALNMVLAKDKVALLSAIDMEIMGVNSEQQEHEHDAVYVYCCNGDGMTADDAKNGADKLRLALDSKRYSKVVVAIEGVKINKNMAMLDDYANASGCKTYYHKSSAIKGIADTLNT